MIAFLQIASNVATPLALAGLFATILFYILRRILSPKLLKPIKGEHSFLIVKSIITYLFWLSLASLIIGGVSYIIVNLVEFPSSSGARRLTDAQRDKFSEAAKLPEGVSYDIQVLPDTSCIECGKYAKQFEQLLRSNGWHLAVGVAGYKDGIIPELGVIVIYDLDHRPSGATTLEKGLDAAKIKFTHEQPRFVDPPTVHLFIAINPRD